MYQILSTSDNHYSFQDGIVPYFETQELAEIATQELAKEWDIEGCECPMFTVSQFSACVSYGEVEEWTEECALETMKHGVQDEDAKGLCDYQAQVTLSIDDKEWTLIFQPLEKTEGMRYYAGAELERGACYGLDADESQEMIEYYENCEQEIEKIIEAAQDMCYECAKITLEHMQ